MTRSPSFQVTLNRRFSTICIFCLVIPVIAFGCSRSPSPEQKRQAPITQSDAKTNPSTSPVAENQKAEISNTATQRKAEEDSSDVESSAAQRQPANAPFSTDGSVRMLEWIAERDAFRRRLDEVKQRKSSTITTIETLICERVDATRLRVAQSVAVSLQHTNTCERVDATRLRAAAEDLEIGIAITEENQRLLEDVRRRRLDMAHAPKSRGAAANGGIMQRQYNVDVDLVSIERRRTPNPTRIKMAEWKVESNDFRRSVEKHIRGITSGGLTARIDEIRNRAFAEKDYDVAREMLQENKQLLEDARSNELARRRKFSQEAALRQADQDLIDLAKRRRDDSSKTSP